jgi:cytochrome c553
MFGLPSPRHISTYRRRHQPSRPPSENLLEDRMPTTSISGMRQVDAPVGGRCIPQRRLFPRDRPPDRHGRSRTACREPLARLVSLVCSKTVLGVLGILAALVPPAAPADAAEVHEVPTVASPGNTAEAQVFLSAKLLVCNTCHGAEGVPRNANVPVIWGQQEAFLLKQMHDVQSGARDSEVMSWMSTALTPSEVEAAMAYAIVSMRQRRSSSR